MKHDSPCERWTEGIPKVRCGLPSTHHVTPLETPERTWYACERHVPKNLASVEVIDLRMPGRIPL